MSLGSLARLTLAALVAVAIALPASAQQQLDPRNLLFEMIDQLQTGRNRPVLYGPEVQNTVAAQTNDTGVYPALRQLGRVSDIRLTRTQPLQGGYIFYMTAIHATGQSAWQLGYSTRTQRIEAFQFDIAGGAQPPVNNPAPPPVYQPPTQPQPQPQPTTSGKKPVAPPRTAGPIINPPPAPPVYQPPPLPPVPAAQPIPGLPPVPTAPTRVLTPPPSNPPVLVNQPTSNQPTANPPAVNTPAGNPNTPDMSAACRKFPNLC